MLLETWSLEQPVHDSLSNFSLDKWLREWVSGLRVKASMFYIRILRLKFWLISWFCLLLNVAPGRQQAKALVIGFLPPHRMPKLSSQLIILTCAAWIIPDIWRVSKQMGTFPHIYLYYREYVSFYGYIMLNGSVWQSDAGVPFGCTLSFAFNVQLRKSPLFETIE